MLAKRRGRNGRTPPQADERSEPRLEFRADSNNGRLANGPVGQQRRFDITQVDPIPAQLYLIVATAEELERAQRAEADDIARSVVASPGRPGALEEARGNLGVPAEVPRADARPRDPELARETRRLAPSPAVHQFDLAPWDRIVSRVKEPAGETTIAIVGKYVGLTESYKSLSEALTHGGIASNCRVNLKYVDSEALERHGINGAFDDVDGILVPGGFGERGSEGKISAIRYARENQLPFFGICLGMQMAVVEFARYVCEIDDAHSSEFQEEAKNPVIHIMEEQKKVKGKGGTMRLGAYPCDLSEATLARRIYGMEHLSERHRHRFEFNNAYRKKLQECGLVLSGINPESDLVEIVELEDHPWFLGCQFHPEFKSRPMEPHPLFESFVGACLKKRQG